MAARRAIFVAPFGELSEPRVLARLAAEAEAAGFDGFFLWDHIVYTDVEQSPTRGWHWRRSRAPPSACGSARS